VIPIRQDPPHLPDFDKAADRQPNTVERLIGRLKQDRRIATRDEDRAPTDLAMVVLGTTLLWLK
jgi:transposase